MSRVRNDACFLTFVWCDGLRLYRFSIEVQPGSSTRPTTLVKEHGMTATLMFVEWYLPCIVRASFRDLTRCTAEP